MGIFAKAISENIDRGLCPHFHLYNFSSGFGEKYANFRSARSIAGSKFVGN
ncbi:hypothetical protein [Chamaesiphon sp. OTE_75_metabat_556]|uniref:hypothetical protein n=1 Tax=Chamaesiphon sp. OTE_75_metabat_556 TaxID=2964692 RepID=UPI00286A502B|nr:hypothetical protein [Chamaesiphon sp. OTE_75_metabat_556]